MPILLWDFLLWNFIESQFNFQYEFWERSLGPNSEIAVDQTERILTE